MAPATEKSAGAFRTISEVSAELDLPQHVLRFWETKFQAIRPLKRGGGRRYYRPEDLDLLRRIRALLYDDGYTIKGVQKLLRQSGLPEAAPESPAPEGPANDAHAAGPGPASVAPAAQAGETASLNDSARKELESVLGELEALRNGLK